MPQMIFANLPVTDVAASRRFYQALGYTINEQFSDATAACVVLSDTIYFMILNHDRFQGFATQPLADPAKGTSVMLALSQDSRAAVDALTEAALAAGGNEPKAAQDLGFMYSRTFQDPDGQDPDGHDPDGHDPDGHDPDGNVLEGFWMDRAAMQA